MADTNVVIPIKFDIDDSSIKSSIDQLQGSGAVDGSSAAVYKSGNAELTKRNSLLAAEKQLVVNVNGELQKEAVTLSQIGKGAAAAADAIIKGAAAATSSIQRQKSTVEALQKSLANAKDNGATETVIKNITRALDANKLKLAEVEAAEKRETVATVSLKAEKRKLQAQIAELLLTGQQESDLYAELVSRAGEIDDAMGDAADSISRAGSDTKGLDNTLQVATGVTAAFSGAQSAMALFGEESEDTQKILLKVNSAMALLAAIQQIQALTRDENLKSLVLETRQRVINNANIAIETGLTSTSVVVRTAATAAQWLLNAAMSANPIGLLVTAFALVITAVVAYTRATTKAKQEQLALTSAVASATTGLQAEYDAYDQIAKMEDATLKATNARQSAVLDAELRIDRVKAQSTAHEIENLQKILKVYKTNSKERIEVEKKLRELQDQLESQNTEGQAKAIALSKQVLEEQQGDRIAAAEAAIKIARNGSAGELQAKRQLAAEQRKVALENLDKQTADESVKAKERLVINADYNDAVEALAVEAQDKNKATLQRRLNAEKAAIDNLLQVVREGSNEQLKVQLDQLDKQAAIDKAGIDRRNVSAGIIAKEELNIIQRTEEAKRKLRIDYANRQDAEVSQIELVAAQARVAAYREGTDQYFAAQRVALGKGADNERLSVEQSTDSQEKKASAILLINANLNKALDDISRQQTQRDFDRQASQIANLNALAQSRLNIKANDPTLNEAEAFTAQQAARTKELETIEGQRSIIHTKALQGLYASDQDYQNDLTANTIAQEEKRAQIEQSYAARKKQLYKDIAAASIQFAQEAANAIFEVDKAQRDAQLNNALNALAMERDKALESKNLTENQKAAIQNRFDQQARRLKNEAAKKERKAAIAQAVVSGAIAVVQSFAQLGPIAGAIAAVLVAATTALQIAKINATPLPAYAKGTKNAAPGWKLVGEEGPELIHSRGGETILTATESKKVMKSWDSMPSDHSELIAAYAGNGEGRFDYDKLGQAVAKYMPQQPNITMSADHHGWSMYEESRNRKTRILNKRYSIR